MSLLNKFINSLTNKSVEKLDLQRQIEELLTGETEESVLKITAMSGIMARVIFSNLKVDAAEIKVSSDILAQDFSLDQYKVEALLKLAVHHVESFMDRDFYQYNKIINDVMDNNEKYKFLISLFKVAAADGLVENTESEDLRFITQGFNLSHQHFIAARAVVVDYLAASKRT
jgi:uncharacterized tellurite resistance protein B-like protein